MDSKQSLDIEARKSILDAEVAKQVQSGWRVVSRTDTTAQLSKTQGPNGCAVIVLLLFFILPGILYLLFGSSTQNLYLEVDDYGRVKTTAQ